MSNKQHHRRRPSRRERRMKIMIYIMVAGMILSTVSAGLAYLL